MDVSDLAGKFTGKPKAGRGRFNPATNRCFSWRSVKCGIDFDRWELTGIKLQPVRLWQLKWIEHTAPVLKAPCARANAYFLLVKKIQMESKKYSVLFGEKEFRLGEETMAKFDGPEKLTTLPHLDANGYSRVFITRCHTVSFT